MLPIWGLQAQSVSLPHTWEDMIELWNETSDTPLPIEEVEELYEQLSGQPVDINDTVHNELLRLFFISPFQCVALRTYIEQYGPLLSVDELLLVPGFDTLTLAMLRPVVVASSSSGPAPFSWRDLRRKGRHSLLMGAGGTIERARGYRENIYEGDPYRLYWRYRYRSGSHLQFQLSADKDAGEALFSGSQRQGFDHYGFHLLLKDIGRLKCLAIGTFNLQFGQGATLWTGFAPYTVLGGLGYRSAHGVGVSSAFLEYGYLTGIAATVVPKAPWELTLFYANTPLDATIPASMSGKLRDGMELVQSIYLSGYHRTPVEVAKRHQLDEELYGANITYRRPDWKVGLTGYRTLLDKYIQPANYRYNYYYFSGYENLNMGVDATYRFRNLLSYGEISLSQNRHIAALAGLDYMYGASSRLSAIVHHYDAWYWNLHADAPSMAGHTRNEQGLTLTAVTPLLHRLRFETSFAYCRFPEMRSTAYGASHGTDVHLRLSRTFSQSFSASVLYRYKRQDANIKVSDEYELHPASRHQCQLDMRYDIDKWHYSLRAAVVDYCLVGEHSHGLLLHGDVKWTPVLLPLTLSLRLAAFNVSDYNARLYSVESGVAFDNSGTFFYNRGVRLYTVMHCNLSRWLVLAVKYSLSRYTDDHLFGSGYEALGKSHRQQWHLQLRANL